MEKFGIDDNINIVDVNNNPGRIRKLRSILGLTQKEFGDLLVISRSRISALENDEVLSERIIQEISSVFRVNKEWLRTGDGNIFKETGIPKHRPIKVKDNSDELIDRGVKLEICISRLKDLTEEELDLIYRMLNNL